MGNVVILINGETHEAEEKVAAYIKDLEKKVGDQETEIKNLAAGVENVIASRVKLAEKGVVDFVAKEIHSMYAGIGHYTEDARNFIIHIFDKAPDHMKPTDVPPVADVKPPETPPAPAAAAPTSSAPAAGGESTPPAAGGTSSAPAAQPGDNSGGMGSSGGTGGQT